MLTIPSVNEYSTVYQYYINLVTEDVIGTLSSNSEKLAALLLKLPKEKWNYRYASDKWNLKEVVGHIIDNEIIMIYRLIRISRGDITPLLGYDQDEFIKASSYNHYAPLDLIQYYKIVRQMTIATLQGIQSENWSKQGYIGNNKVSARTLAYVIAGHEIHHFNIINEKYLS